MADVLEIHDGGSLLARFVPAAWNSGLSFFSNDADFVQVGAWVYDSGKELAAHRHNEVRREVTRTQEVLFIRKGSILARIYSEEGTLVRELTVRVGDVLILLAGGHGYRILEDGTEVLEVKNGPYAGAERDRTRFAEAGGAR
jgi:hypothetical protein